jgi:hypothetical protein
VVVTEAVDGVHQVGLLAERVGTAGTDADLQRQFDRAHGGRPVREFKVSCHRSGEEHGGRADEWRVNDLDVVVVEWEGGFGCGRQPWSRKPSMGSGSFSGG